jgi:hypothetical protein
LWSTRRGIPTRDSRQALQESSHSGGLLLPGAHSRYFSQVNLPRRYSLEHKRGILWEIGGRGRMDEKEVWTCPTVQVTRI